MIAMDDPEKEITAKDVLSPVSTQRDGSVNGMGKNFAVIGSKNRHSRISCSASEDDASEDDASSSYESLDIVSLAARKRKRTTRNPAIKLPYEPKNAEEHDELVQSVTISDNKNDPSPSAYGNIEAEWLLSKLEELQERLDEDLRKLTDEMDGDHSLSMHLHCTSADPPTASQPDLHTINNQTFLKDSSNCSMELDEQHLESPPALSSGASISPALSSVTTPQVSSKHSPLTKQAQSTESQKTSLERYRSPKFRRVNRHWDTSEQKFITMEPAAEPGHHDATQAEDYMFVVRRDLNCDKTHINTTVEIKDSLLRECLQNVMGNISGVNFVEENPVLDPKTLFL